MRAKYHRAFTFGARGPAGRAAESTLVSVGLDPHRAGELAADRMLTLAEPYEHRPTERLAIHDLEASVERDAMLGEVAQHRRVRIRHADEPSRGTDRQLVEAAGRALVDLEQGRGDRIAVRIDRRVTQPGGDQRLELLGNRMLEHLSLGVHTIPRHPELLSEKQLQQPVMAQHLQSHTPTLVGQPHPVVRLMLDDPDLSQLAHHPGHPRRGHPEPGREIVRRYRRAATSLERIQRLRVTGQPGPDPRRRLSSASVQDVAAIAAAAARGKALGDPTRMTIAVALRDGGELCVCDLAWITSRPENLVGHHLRTLRAAGLPSSRRQYKIVFYALTELGARLLDTYLTLTPTGR